MTDLAKVNSKIQRSWNDWVAIELVGSGSHGEVYKAVYRGNINCEAAIKLITVPRNEAEIDALGDQALREKAHNEYYAVAASLDKALSRLAVLNSVPNIVNIEAYSIKLSDNGVGYDVLIRYEYLPSLGNVSELSEREVLKVGMDICMAMEEAEKAGIIHRNIKPSNIFSTGFGTYKLGDYGLASVLDMVVTDKTVYLNSPKYLAPELASGEECDIRADIYSLAGVLKALLPYQVSPQLKAVLDKACAEEPSQRYGCTTEFKQALVNVYTSIMFGRTAADENVSNTAGGSNAADPGITEVYDISDAVSRAEEYAEHLDEASNTEKPMTADTFDVNDYSRAFNGGSNADSVLKEILEYPEPKKKKSKVPIIILLIILGLLLVGIIVFGAVKLSSIIGVFSGSGITETENTSVESIAVEKLPLKLEYRTGEAVDLDGLVLSVRNVDGSSYEVTEGFTAIPESVSGSGDQTVTVLYGGCYTTFSVDVISAALESLVMVSPPERTVYSIGEEYDFSGLVLNAHYSDGAVVEVREGFVCNSLSADELGERTVKITYGGKEISLVMSVTESTVKALVMKSMPARLNYFVGESLDPAGMRLNVTRTNGIMATVSSGFTVSPQKFTKPGKQSVTVTYGDKSISFDVEVDDAKLNNIEIGKLPSKTSYYVGEALVTDGLTVNCVYTDGSKKTVTSGFTVSPTVLSSVGNQYVTVSLDGRTTGFNVSVKGVSLVSLTVTGNPAKLNYTVGDTVDITGITLSALYSNGVSENVGAHSVSVSPTVLDTAGDQLVTVSYGGVSATFTVNVAEPISLSGSCGNNAVWTLKSGVLTISGTGDTKGYAYNAAPWSEYAGQIRSVVVESGILSIGNNMFSGLSAQKISIPDTVTGIADNAFYMCRNLTEISVASTNRQFKSNSGILYSKDMKKLLAYPMAKSDTSFTVPDTVTTIGGYEIFGGTALRSITIGESVYSIADNAFSNASKLEKIDVRLRCTVLTSVDGVLYTKNMNEIICYPANKTGTSYTVPDTVKYIRGYAFKGNTHLETVTIPSSVVEIGVNAFSGCSQLNYVNYLSTGADWAAIAIGNGNAALTDAVNFG